MTHPLAQFDLDADADERAVKRAYAKRLKVTRPDEDAAGFQALNDAYQQALAYIRWRDAQAEEASSMPTSTPEEIPAPPPEPAIEPESLFRPEGERSPVPVPKPRIPIPGPFEDPDSANDRDYVPPSDALPEYVFSVADFVADMRSGGHFSNPVRFRQWMRKRMAGWPMTAKPAFFHAVIVHVLENQLLFHPDIYDVLIEELGLNDIRTGSIDPMEIAQYREELVKQYEIEIFTPAPPVVLRSSWYQSRGVEIGAIAFLCLCGFILLTMSFLQPEPEAPQKPWYQSATGTSDSPMSIDMVFNMDKAAIDLLNSSANMSGKQRIETLDKIIALLWDRKELGNERLLALALYNKGHALQHDDRDRGYAAYGEIQTRFQSRRDHDLALFVAASSVNMGLEDYLHDRFDTAMAAYDVVIAQYGFITEGRIGMQVYKAMFGKAEVLNAQGRKDDALRKLDEADAKFANSPDPVLREKKAQNAKFRAKIVSVEK